MSQDGWFLVIERELSEIVTNAPISLLTQFVPSTEKDVQAYVQKLMKENPLIKIHPKFLGYNQAVAAITGRSKKCEEAVPNSSTNEVSSYLRSERG